MTRCAGRTNRGTDCRYQGLYDHDGRSYCAQHHPVWRARIRESKRVHARRYAKRRFVDDLITREQNLMLELRAVQKALETLGLRQPTKMRRIA